MQYLSRLRRRLPNRQCDRQTGKQSNRQTGTDRDRDRNRDRERTGERGRERERERRTQSDRQTDKQTNRYTLHTHSTRLAMAETSSAFPVSRLLRVRVKCARSKSLRERLFLHRLEGAWCPHGSFKSVGISCTFLAWMSSSGSQTFSLRLPFPGPPDCELQQRLTPLYPLLTTTSSSFRENATISLLDLVLVQGKNQTHHRYPNNPQMSRCEIRDRSRIWARFLFTI